MGKTLPDQQQIQQQRPGCKPLIKNAFSIAFGMIIVFCCIVMLTSFSDGVNLINLIISIILLILSIIAIIVNALAVPTLSNFIYNKFPALRFLFLEPVASLQLGLVQNKATSLLSSKLWNVPSDGPLKYFVGRKKFLEDLEEIFKSNRRQAIGGMRCLGKSIVALKYVYISNYQHVLWLRASSPEALGKDCHEIWLKMQPEPASSAPQGSIVSQKDMLDAIRTIKHWLERNSNWLLVLDQYRDNSEAQDFLHLNIERRGHILITTDLSPIHIPSAGYNPLPSLLLDEAATVLLHHAGKLEHGQTLAEATPKDQEYAKKIANRFGCSGLALTHAGKHAHRDSCCPLNDKFLEKHEQSPNHFFDKPFDPKHFIDPQHSKLKDAWDVFTLLNIDAASLLKLCAFFASAPIPLQLLEEVFDIAGIDFKQFDSMRMELSKYCLASYNNSKKTLLVPAILQELIRVGTYDSPDGLRSWAEWAVKAVSKQFPEVNFPRWETCHRYLPHAQACCRHIEKYNFEFPEAITLLYNTACYLLACEKYTEAEHLLTTALNLLEPNSTSSLLPKIHISLGELYHSQGMFDKAKDRYEDKQAKSASQPEEKVARLIHLGQLEDDLGNHQQAKGSYDEAQRCIDEAPDKNILQMQQAMLWNNRGCLQIKQRNYEAALHSLITALGIFKAYLKENYKLHPYVMECEANLVTLSLIQRSITPAALLMPVPVSITYQDKSNQDKNKFQDMLPVIESYQAPLTIGQGTIGSQRLQVANAHGRLAQLYCLLDKRHDAEEEYKQAIAIYTAQSPDHPNRAIIMDNYAAYLDIVDPYGRYREKRELREQALRIREDYLKQVKRLLILQPSLTAASKQVLKPQSSRKVTLQDD